MPDKTPTKAPETHEVLTPQDNHSTMDLPARHSKGVMVMFLIVLIASLLLVGGVWYYMNKQFSDQQKANNNQIAELNKKASDLQTQIDEQKKSVQEVNGNFVEIKELGIKYPLNSSTSGLVYYYNCSESSCTIGLSSQALVDKVKQLEPESDVKCSAKESALGKIVRMSKGGVPPGSDQPIESVTGARKIGDHYYLYISPQAACSTNAEVNKVEVSDLNNKAKKLINNLQAL